MIHNKYICAFLLICISGMSYADWKVMKDGEKEISASITAKKASEKNTVMTIGCTDIFAVNDNGDLRFFIYTEDPNFKNAGEIMY